MRLLPPPQSSAIEARSCTGIGHTHTSERASLKELYCASELGTDQSSLRLGREAAHTLLSIRCQELSQCTEHNLKLFLKLESENQVTITMVSQRVFTFEEESTGRKRKTVNALQPPAHNFPATPYFSCFIIICTNIAN